MLQDEENFDVDARFEYGLSQAGSLWSRLGIEPDFHGKHVLEVGSGLGFLTAAIALKGAESVLGVDTWEPRVAFGTRKIAERFPHLKTVRFDSTPTDRMEGADRFDVIVSQNTFEHVGDVALRRTAGDERVREEHDALNGQTFEYVDPPSEGLPALPHQHSSASLHGYE